MGSNVTDGPVRVASGAEEMLEYPEGGGAREFPSRQHCQFRGDERQRPAHLYEGPDEAQPRGAHHAGYRAKSNLEAREISSAGPILQVLVSIRAILQVHPRNRSARGSAGHHHAKAARARERHVRICLPTIHNRRGADRSRPRAAGHVVAERCRN